MSVSQLASQRLVTHLGLKDRDPDEVIADARLVDELTKHPGWKVLTTAFEERERRELKAVMGKPASDSASEYADFVGYLKGLRAIEPTARAIADEGKKLEQKQKDDELAAGKAA